MTGDPGKRRALLGGSVVLAVLVVALAWSARDVLFAPASEDDSPTPPRAAGEALSPTEIAASAMPATVQIRALDAIGQTRGGGTGFFVTADGLMLTSLHVINGAYSLEVSTLYGRTLDSVRFVAADGRRDLALLKVRTADARPLTLAADEEPAVGERVFVIGNPHGQTGTFTDGLVSAVRQAAGVTFVQISAPVAPGSSGGPVVNDRGEVIGVATLRLQRAGVLNFAIPVRYLRRLVDSAAKPAPYSRTLLPLVRRPDIPATGLGEEGHYPADETRDVIRRQLDRSDSLLTAHGGAPHGEMILGSIAPEDTSQRRVRLEGGKEYVVAGYCDEHCTLLSLSITAPSGRVLDADLEADDRPKLRFTPLLSGEFTLRVTMTGCDTKACRFGARIYQLGQ